MMMAFDNSELTARILKGAAQWNPWFIKQPRYPKIDLSGGHLVGRILHGIDLHKVVFPRANLSGGHFIGSTFEMSDLSGADAWWDDYFKVRDAKGMSPVRPIYNAN